MSETETDNGQTSSWRDKSLKTAGYSYVLGDAAMAVAGVARGKNWGSAVGGAATWFAGGLGAGYFGNPDIHKQLEIQAGKLEAHLKKKGIAIPADARAQSELLKSKAAWQHVSQFMYEHPSELLNGMYALGSAMLLHGAIKNELTPAGGKTILPTAGFKNVSSLFWIGALVGTGALIGLFVKEDPEAGKNKEHHGMIARAMNYVKEQPLRASAALYGVNNGFLALQAWQDFQKAKPGMEFHGTSFKPHYASSLQLAAYLFSNFMLFMSPRNQITKRGFATDDLAKLEHAAASIIAAQPPQMQQQVLADVSAFMATQKGVMLPAEKIAQDLATRVTALTGERMQTGVKRFADAEQLRREQAAQIAPSV